MRNHSRLLQVLVLLSFGAFVTRGADLEEAFRHPPESAKPLTWWHWVDGNVTKAGITGDLEAMKRAGLGGCYLFSIAGYFPKGPASFRDPQWFDLLDHTVKEAERLGLVFGVHNCDGWSQAGGPWITPETSMKELTHSTVDVEGPRQFDEVLPAPEKKENFYRDIAVIAFPMPDGKRLNAPGSTTVSGTIKQSGLDALSDGKPATQGVFPVSTEGHRIEFVLPEPKTVRTLIFHNVDGYVCEEDTPVLLEVSTDGKTWQASSNFTLAWDTDKGQKPITVALGEIKARFLRMSFTNSAPLRIGEVEISDAAKLQFAEAKAGWLRCRGHGGETQHYANYPGPDRQMKLAPNTIVHREDVVDLTSELQPDGRLKWDAPTGHWHILRVGYTSNGRMNRPASDAGRGLECDKLDPKVVRPHLEQYVGQLVKRFGPAVGKTFKAVETDSWECDVQNWTGGLEKRFKEKVGIDIIPWLPLLIEGRVVDSIDFSERMLWDWRRFLADQFQECFFGQVASYLKQKNLTYVCEGSGRQMYLYDAIGYQRYGDVPMGEFWVDTGVGQGVRADNKVASSAAHIRGLQTVAAESYTSGSPFAIWKNHPYTLKPLGDKAYCAGVNQFVFHTFAHQPYNVTGPGFSMAVWGLNCNRANTWWELGRAWMAYLTRCNELLREGRFVADVLWFIGEDVPNRIGWRDELNPPLPKGYDFDGCDATALLEAKVKDGRIVLPSGMEYRVLLLGNRTTMRPKIAAKIGELAEQGAIIVGPRPMQSSSLADLGDGDRQVQELAQRIWGDCDGTKAKEHVCGKGRVFWGMSFPEIFGRIGLAPDFEYQTAAADAEVLYIHRRIGNAEVYFVSNQKPRTEQITARFRVSNRQPEVWDPVNGTIKRPAVFQQTSSVTELALTLDPAGSEFIVFRSPAAEKHPVAVKPAQTEAELTANGGLLTRLWSSGPFTMELNDGSSKNGTAIVAPPVEVPGPWAVQFPPGLGAPKSAEFDKLVSWTQRPEDGIRFFSGTATYFNNVEISADRLGAGRELWLDLGDVQVIAEVRLNDRDLGVLWKPPFRINITPAAKAGKNRLEVRVTNLWPNRMIGDEQLPDSVAWQAKKALPAQWPDWLLQGKPRPDGRVTFCTKRAYKKADRLLDSGLIGPVRLVSAENHGL